jgi:hypothetical protein
LQVFDFRRALASISFSPSAKGTSDVESGLTLTIYQSIAYFIQWIIVGAAIGLIYKPS